MLAVPALGAQGDVVRSVSTETPSVGDTVEVTITVPPGSIMGIVETIPGGFAFAGTTLPEGRYRVSGQQIILSAIDDTEIVYTLSAGQNGNCVISGVWEDFGTGETGEIAETSLTATGTGSAAAHEAPGFGIAVAAGALLLAGRRCLR
ncbi:hypothetical protein ABH15_09005 [Methanoculleus taiwanensis]|uniref:PGF-CTERM sorting domain-containing protein n=2 Tax=Methanoculleus taiwanensis TaxID=1550565 RepID=A0A498H3V3_9EURY|nr:hypothetical protein ABH15_09005 [Methanoculleus taiwanensis]